MLFISKKRRWPQTDIGWMYDLFWFWYFSLDIICWFLYNWLKRRYIQRSLYLFNLIHSVRSLALDMFVFWRGCSNVTSQVRLYVLCQKDTDRNNYQLIHDFLQLCDFLMPWNTKHTSLMWYLLSAGNKMLIKTKYCL